MRHELKTMLIFSSPALIFGVFLLYMLLWDYYYSFTNWSLFNPIPQFVGLQTYVKILTNPITVASLERSMLLAVLLVAAGNALGIILAGLLFFLRSNTQRNVYLSILIYPLAMPMIANAFIWLWLYNVEYGLDYVFKLIGLPAINWLGPQNAFWSIFLVTTWAYSGLAVIFYLAMLMNVPQSVIDAAKVDGAGTFTIYLRILLPNVRGALIISSALLFLFALRIFSLPYGMVALNPFVETAVINLYWDYISEHFAEATAIAGIVIAIAVAVVVPYALYGLKRWITQG
ncbi:sugar ABC transporter permease [Vulcanisaeta sp. JCM 16161]|uniref:glucose ABC transporter permease GlcT n=1 Tax=Vulcanisaeta sp. JCM 16161 TaxID=1295372 RepID=UPI0006D2C493